MFCQNICNEIAVNAIFQFSNYNSVETLSCLSNGNKTVLLVESNTEKISAMFPIYPL